MIHEQTWELTAAEQVSVESEVFDAEARKSVVHCHCTAESPVGPYSMECILMMDFDETGEKCTNMKEMMDSTALTSFLAKVQG